MANLLESYKGRIAVAEKYFSQKNNGAKLSYDRKIATAMCLQNTAKFLNEAFATSTSATQKSDIGNFKKFALDITNIAVPNLLVHDLFLVQPMSSFTGYMTYMSYSLGDGTKVQDPFGFGPMTTDRAGYTAGAPFVEKLAAGEALSFTPEATHGAKYCVLQSDGTYSAWANLTETSIGWIMPITATLGGKVRYWVADNITVPQAALPTLKGHLEGIALQAHARKIAVYYDQIAAFTMKNDYNIDFQSQIAQQAQSEIEYEVDGEAVYLIKDNAPAANTVTWTDLEDPTHISYSMKAEGFARAIEEAKAKIYKATNRFTANWMVVGPEVMPILTFVTGFSASNATAANGPYMAGTVAGLKVFVSPALGKECYLGVLGADGKTAVAVYAPYLPIVPTQLLGFADGAMEQGFSTMYDLKLLNANLISKITITDGTNSVNGVVSTEEI